MKYEQHTSPVKLDSGLAALITERCRSQKVSPFRFHLAVFKTLLFRFLGVNDLCIGITDANRKDAEDTSVIGLIPSSSPVPVKYYAKLRRCSQGST
jgi:hybrid polyketide synthase/nonribosomal peptide synthetase ACE1